VNNNCKKTIVIKKYFRPNRPAQTAAAVHRSNTKNWTTRKTQSIYLIHPNHFMKNHVTRAMMRRPGHTVQTYKMEMIQIPALLPLRQFLFLQQRLNLRRKGRICRDYQTHHYLIHLSVDFHLNNLPKFQRQELN